MRRVIPLIVFACAGLLLLLVLSAQAANPASFPDVTPTGVLPITPVAVSTAEHKQVNPAVSYNTQGDEFVVIWADARNDETWDIYGQRLSAWAIPIKDNFLIATTNITSTESAPNPQIAWNTTDNEFLVAWHALESDGVLHGQRLTPSGLPNGELLQLSPVSIGPEKRIGLVYNADDNEYLLVWSLYRSVVRLQRLGHTGARLGSDAPVCFECGPAQANPVVAYNTTAQEYLVAWQQNPGSLDVVAQRVSRDGIPQTPGLDVATQYGTVQNLPDVTYNPSTNAYVVVWRDGRFDPNKRGVWGRTLDADGIATTDGISLTTYLADQRSPAVEWHDGTGAGYLSLWADTRVHGGTKYSDDSDLMARWLDANGLPLGADLLVSPGCGATNPDLTYSSAWARYLMVWQQGCSEGDPSPPWEYDIYAARYITGPPPTSTPTATPTPTVTPTATRTPTSTPAVEPTDTLTPTPTATATRPLAQVQGVVYHDLNNDGVWNQGEPTMAGALVEAYVYPQGAWTAAFTTYGDGAYSFDLLPGTYQVEESRAPVGYALSPRHNAPLIQSLQAGQQVRWDFPNVLSSQATPTTVPRVYVPMVVK